VVTFAQPVAPALPVCRKSYVTGARPDIRVPVREIPLSPTAGRFGVEANPPLHTYDTSGPYTDADVTTDIQQGLSPLRQSWILKRDDVEAYDGRQIQPVDNGFKPSDPRANMAVFPGLTHRPLRAKAGRTVTQLHYARRGVVTPEMEFI